MAKSSKKENKKDKPGKKPANKKPANKKPGKKASDKKNKKNSGKKAKDTIVDGVPTDLVYVKASKTHGKGMFARKKIKKGVVLGPLLGRPTKTDGTYVLWLTEKKGLRVTNDYRFINHSFKPNCELTGTEVITTRSIKKDEELFHHYGWEE